MTQDEIIAMAKVAGFEFEMQQALSGEHMLFTDGSVSIGRMQRLVALVAEKAAADERERLFGKERDGEMRLMLHRWDQGRCWAAATHFTAEQTRFGPSGVLDRAAERMSAEMDAAIRARSPQ